MPYWFSHHYPVGEIKGNRVKIPNSPAAVSFNVLFGQYSCHCLLCVRREGVRTEASQKTCHYKQSSVISGIRVGHLQYLLYCLKHRRGREVYGVLSAKTAISRYTCFYLKDLTLSHPAGVFLHNKKHPEKIGF